MRRRWNPDETTEAARRVWITEGTPEAARRYLRAVVQAQRVHELPVGFFVQALREDPFLLRAMRPGDHAAIAFAAAVERTTEPKNWYPAHDQQNVCPRGHTFGERMIWGAVEFARPVYFAFVFGGINIYHDVTLADPEGVSVEMGSQETGTSAADFLICEVCSACWQQTGDLDFS